MPEILPLTKTKARLARRIRLFRANRGAGRLVGISLRDSAHVEKAVAGQIREHLYQGVSETEVTGRREAGRTNVVRASGRLERFDETNLHR